MFRWNIVKLIAEDFFSLLFPRLCQACGEPLVRNENIICTGCLIEIPKTDFHLHKENQLEKNFWGRSNIEAAAAYTYYRRGSRIQKLIQCLKYKGFKTVGVYLGQMYGSVLKDTEFISSIDLIVPVPLHRSKKRKRGFNQSSLIAEGLANATGIEYSDKLLLRTRRTSTQTNKSRVERWENVDGVFEVTSPEMIINRHILLVDDVITTGSTIEACANELLKTKGVRLSVAAIATAIM